MATILDSTALSFQMPSIGHSPLYTFELVTIHQMSGIYNAALTNALRMTVEQLDSISINAFQNGIFF